MPKLSEIRSKVEQKGSFRFDRNIFEVVHLISQTRRTEIAIPLWQTGWFPTSLQYNFTSVGA